MSRCATLRASCGVRVIGLRLELRLVQYLLGGVVFFRFKRDTRREASGIARDTYNTLGASSCVYVGEGGG